MSEEEIYQKFVDWLGKTWKTWHSSKAWMRRNSSRN